MKRKNKKLLTFLLAGALCVSTIGGFASMKGITSSAADENAYKLSDIFAKENSASFSSDADNNTQFSLSKNSLVRIKRNLALKWYSEGEAKYLNFKFAFADDNFSSISFKVESASAVASADNKAVNTIKFVNNDEAVSVFVNDVDSGVTVNVGVALAVSLSEGVNDGEFGVNLTVGEETKAIGTFTNVGANFAEYTASKMSPLSISAEIPAGALADAATTKVTFTELNGQSFSGVELENNEYYVKDNAAPVLVVNEDVSGFLLGTSFKNSLSYKVIDVLQLSSLKEEKTYYQYNPTDEEVTYKKLDDNVVFLDTEYTTADGKQTTVYREENREYVSIKITLSDKVNDAATYDLSWYAGENTVKPNGYEGDIEYLVIDRNTEGPTYNYIVATADADDEEKGTNVVDKEQLALVVKEFQDELDTNAETVLINSDITLPSMEKLFADNNGYRNLKFTISYKTPGSDSTKLSTNLAYNALKLTVDHEGDYEFKVFANDKTGNKMMYYDADGKLVVVDSTTVWDIEEIPTFRFTIKNTGMKADPSTTATTSYRSDEKNLGERYTFSDVKIIGAMNSKETYKLYRIDEDKARELKISFDEKDISSITYAALAEKLAGKFNEYREDYIGELYLDAFVELLANKLGADVTADMVKQCFVEINEFDSRITEDNNAEAWNNHNKYNWSISSQAFTAAETGNYVIFADYWENEIPTQRVAAYKVITVEEKSDGTAGETTSWVEQNIVSVILFGIAGILLIVVIILLFVKPSEETLEDVEQKATKRYERVNEAKKVGKKNNKKEDK